MKLFFINGHYSFIHSLYLTSDRTQMKLQYSTCSI